MTTRTKTKTTGQPGSGLSGARLSPDARAFCRREGITRKLSLALDLVSPCFPIVGNPVVNLVQDPKVDGAAYLVIEIQVRGGVKETVASHRRFALEASQQSGAKREMIRLHYEIT
jgi:hypothetical protein